MRTQPVLHVTHSSCIAAGLLAAIACSIAAAAPPREPVQFPLQLSDCRLESATGGSASARCGWLQVAENPDDPAGRSLRLRVVVIPALRLKAEADPLVILAGGPGQGASDFYGAVSAAFRGIRRDRDILLVDQRGTGQSNRLDCEFVEAADFETAGFDAEDRQQLQAQARSCLAALPADPRFYTTSVAVRDLEAVRVALGYERLNFYAVSYGTRVAQHYLRRYPSRVRAVVLDGAVPVDLALGPDAAPRAQQALDALFDRCAADQACETAFPDLHRQFAALRAGLQHQPIQMQLPDPLDGHPTDATFGVAQLSAAVRLLSYSDETASVLPLLIHEAQSSRQPQALVAQYLMIKRNTDAQIAYAMHFAVVCSEDAPRWAQEKIPQRALDASYLGSAFVAGLKAVCDVWPRGLVDDGFNAPLHSDHPVLILSGGNDPVTPQQYGERVKQGFTNGRHLVLAGQGHGQLATGCMPRIIAQFIRSATVADLDTKCLANVTPAPFMLSRTATAP